MTGTDLSMAERKRLLVTTELTEAALQLLATAGFDAVTVDEIVAVAGVSKRTFFRHFASKEDVVVQFLAGMGADISDELAARPAKERPSVALRHAIYVPVATCAEHTDRALRVVQLILSTPALRARWLERKAQWADGLAEELARRVGLDPEADLYPQLAAAMALAAFDAVMRRWSDSDGAADPAELTDRAFAVIAPALDAGIRQPRRTKGA